MNRFRTQGIHATNCDPLSRRSHYQLAILLLLLACLLSCGDDSTAPTEPGPLQTGTWDIVQSQFTYRDVWAESDSNIYVVGITGGLYAGVKHLDGESWHGFNVDDHCLSAVNGSSDRNIYAVGDSGLALHYDGTSWNQMVLPTTVPTDVWLYDVWVDEDGTAYAVGTYGVIMRSSGNAWVQMETPIQPALQAISGHSGYGPYAVGSSGSILYYDSSGWTALDNATTGAEFGLRDVWVTPEHTVYVVGLAGWVFRFDGTTWEDIRPGIRDNFVSVFGTSDTDAYAVTYSGKVLHYNGSDWTTMIDTDTTISDAEMSPSGAIYAVNGSGLILRSTASGWEQMTTTIGENEELYGVVCQGSTIMAAGDYGNALMYSSETGWMSENLNKGHNLRSVWMSALGEAVAVGDYGAVFSYDGSSWESMESGVGGEIHDVWGSSVNDLYAVGDSILLHYNGMSWQPFGPQDHSYNLRAVSGTAQDNIYAAGSHGLIIHYDGQEWSETPIECDRTLYDIWIADENDVFIAGGSGTIVHYNGQTWQTTALEVPGYAPLLGVWGSSGSNVYAVGSWMMGGIVMHYDGSSWNDITPPGMLWAYDVTGNDSGEIYVAASSGTVYRYSPN